MSEQYPISSAEQERFDRLGAVLETPEWRRHNARHENFGVEPLDVLPLAHIRLTAPHTLFPLLQRKDRVSVRRPYSRLDPQYHDLDTERPGPKHPRYRFDLSGTDPHSADFIDDLEDCGFDDVELIRLLQQTEKLKFPLRVAQVDAAKKYIQTGPFQRSDLKRAETETKEFMAFLKVFTDFLRKNATLLGTHRIFSDIDAFVKNIDVLREILNNICVQTNITAGTIQWCVPDKHRGKFRNKEVAPVPSHQFNPYSAVRAGLFELGFEPVLQRVLSIAQLLCFVRDGHVADANDYGSFPTVTQSTDGLNLHFTNLVHPIAQDRTRVIKQCYSKHDPDFLLYEKLFAKGLVMREVGHEEYDTGFLYRFKPGVSQEDIQNFFREHSQFQSKEDELLRLLEKHAFHPYQQIQLDTRHRIIVVTGPNKSGKTLLLEAVGFGVQQCQEARRVKAARADMSLCRGITHNLDVAGDQRRGLSKYGVALETMIGFLNQGTVDDLGLFDEMGQGTNYESEKALTIAILCGCHRRNLRVVCSTHIPEIAEEVGKLEGVQTFHCTRDHRLESGISHDNAAAMELAQEMGMPQDVLDDAKRLLE